MGRLRSPLLIQIDGRDEKGHRRKSRRTSLAGVPRELWTYITDYCEVEDLLRMVRVNRQMARTGMQILCDQYPHVAPALPCSLKIMRGGVRWQVRICLTAIVIKREDLTHNITGGISWVGKILDWVEGMAMAGHVSPARGAWAPILSTASLDLSSLMSDVIPNLPPCSQIEQSTSSRHRSTMSLLGPFSPSKHNNNQIEPCERQIVLDPRKTSFMKYVFLVSLFIVVREERKFERK